MNEKNNKSKTAIAFLFWFQKCIKGRKGYYEQW